MGALSYPEMHMKIFPLLETTAITFLSTHLWIFCSMQRHPLVVQQAQICSQTSIPILWNKVPTLCVHRATTYQAYWATSENLPNFQQWKWHVYCRHDCCWLLCSSAILVKTKQFLTTSHSNDQTSKITTHLNPQCPLTFAQGGISNYLCLISRKQYSK